VGFIKSYIEFYWVSFFVEFGIEDELVGIIHEY